MARTEQSGVSFVHVEKVYAKGQKPAVDDFTFEVKPGEFLVLVGPSGCGKSTTLRMVAGLELPTSGRILIGGRDVTTLPPKDRDIAMVFQNYALYPHMHDGAREHELRAASPPCAEGRDRTARGRGREDARVDLLP